MLYCVQCGAGGPDDARFCNMCGSRIERPSALNASSAAPATAARPHAAPSANVSQPSFSAHVIPSPVDPSSGQHLSPNTLAGAGLRPGYGRVAAFALGAIALMGFGALGAWVALRELPPPTPPVDPGPPLDVNNDEEIDFITGGAQLVERRVDAAVGHGQPAPNPPSTNSPNPPPSSRGTPPSTGGGGSSGRDRPAVAGGQTPSGGEQTGSPAGAPAGRENPIAVQSGDNPNTPSATNGGDPPVGTDPMLDPATDEHEAALELYAARVRRFIRSFLSRQAMTCYEHAATARDPLRGTVVIEFTVGTDGQVSNASPSRNTTGNDRLAQCLAGQVRLWQLPPAPEPVTLGVPFSF